MPKSIKSAIEITQEFEMTQEQIAKQQAKNYWCYSSKFNSEEVAFLNELRISTIEVPSSTTSTRRRTVWSIKDTNKLMPYYLPHVRILEGEKGVEALQK